MSSAERRACWERRACLAADGHLFNDIYSGINQIIRGLAPDGGQAPPGGRRKIFTQPPAHTIRSPAPMPRAGGDTPITVNSLLLSISRQPRTSHIIHRSTTFSHRKPDRSRLISFPDLVPTSNTCSINCCQSGRCTGTQLPNIPTPRILPSDLSGTWCLHARGSSLIL